MQKDAKTI